MRSRTSPASLSLPRRRSSWASRASSLVSPASINRFSSCSYSSRPAVREAHLLIQFDVTARQFRVQNVHGAGVNALAINRDLAGHVDSDGFAPLAGGLRKRSGELSQNQNGRGEHLAPLSCPLLLGFGGPIPGRLRHRGLGRSFCTRTLVDVDRHGAVHAVHVRASGSATGL